MEVRLILRSIKDEEDVGGSFVFFFILRSNLFLILNLRILFSNVFVL